MQAIAHKVPERIKVFPNGQIDNDIVVIKGTNVCSVTAIRLQPLALHPSRSLARVPLTRATSATVARGNISV
jgi:hypothetical protein